MARKKLIRGANAARVEERIADAPGDIPGPSIFQLLKAESGPLNPAPGPERVSGPRRTPAPPAGSAPARRAPAFQAAPAKRQPAVRQAPRPAHAAPPSPRQVPARPARSAPVLQAAPAARAPDAAQEPRPRGKAAISLSGEERGVLLRACTSYRNGLPSYLRSVQREVSLLDGIIVRLSVPQRGRGKPPGP